MANRLPSGLPVPEDAACKLLRFAAEEYAYYDEILSTRPYAVTPLDVIVTAGVNSRIGPGDRIRAIHRGLAERCDPILRSIPEDARLLDEDWPKQAAYDLLAAACSVKWVLLAVATKVLHRKRRALIPMLDGVLLQYYVGEKGVNRAQDKHRAAGEGVKALGMFRADLEACHSTVSELAATLRNHGFPLSEIRILEILIWIETEPAGYYRRG